MVHHDNPAPRVLAYYRRFQQQLAAQGNSGHAGISVDIAGFRRYQGDWVGAVVTPWFIHLLLLPGGGELWRPLAAGVNPVGALTDDPSPGTIGVDEWGGRAGCPAAR